VKGPPFFYNVTMLQCYNARQCKDAFFSPPSLSTGGPNSAASCSLFCDLLFELVFCASHELRVGVMKLDCESCFPVLFLDKSILEAVRYVITFLSASTMMWKP
jgi:hypothetical protein